MQLPVYTPQVQKTAGGDAKIAVPHNIGAAAELAGQGINALGKGVGAVNAVLFKQAADADKTTATAANNEYTQRLNDVLYNDKDGLLHTQMKGADGITSVFEEKEKQIREEIAKKYKFNFNAGRQEFDNMAGRTYAQRMTNVQNHMYAESKKYRDVTFSNAIDNQARFAADNYADAAMVEDAMAGALANVDNYFAGQGEEVVEQQRRRIAGQIAQQVINRAYANGDINAAETFIEKYGKDMDPATLTGYAKNVYQSRLANLQEVTAKGLFAQFGDNIEAAYNHIFSDSFTGNGNNESALGWFKKATADGVSMGTNTCTIGVNKALMAGGFKPIPTWAPTAWKELKDAGRTFTDVTKARTGDIVFWWKPGSDKDADDTSHVGIYDAQTGMVYQSGTSGVKPIKLNTYSITGFARPQGQAASPEDKKKLWAAYQQEVSLRKGFEKQALQRKKEAMDDAMFDLSESGETNSGAYEAIIAQYAGGDPEAARIGRRLMKGYVSVSGKANGTGSNAKSIPGFKDSVTDMLLAGTPPTKILEWVGSDDNIGAKDAAVAKELVRQHAQGKGDFQYEWQDVKAKIMESYKDKDKEYAWSGVKNVLYDKIAQYREENGRKDPTEEWVVNMGTAILTDPIKYKKARWYGSATNEVKGWQLGNKGIVEWYDDPRGGKVIVVKDGHLKKPIHISDEQFAHIAEQGMTPEQAINER